MATSSRAIEVCFAHTIKKEAAELLSEPTIRQISRKTIEGKHNKFSVVVKINHFAYNRLKTQNTLLPLPSTVLLQSTCLVFQRLLMHIFEAVLYEPFISYYCSELIPKCFIVTVFSRYKNQLQQSYC